MRRASIQSERASLGSRGESTGKQGKKITKLAWRSYRSSFLVDVRRAGSWRRYSNEPRIRLFLLHALCEAKRAFPPPHPCVGVDFDPPEPLPWGVPPTAAAAARIRAARLGDTPSLATRLYALPAPLVWNVLTFWASARDPDY